MPSRDFPGIHPTSATLRRRKANKDSKRSQRCGRRSSFLRCLARRTGQLWIDDGVGQALFFLARRGGFRVDYDPCFGRPRTDEGLCGGALPSCEALTTMRFTRDFVVLCLGDRPVWRF
jgi:hypothetical protein